MYHPAKLPHELPQGQQRKMAGGGQPRFLSQVYKLVPQYFVPYAHINPSLFACYTELFPFCVYLPRYVHGAVNVQCTCASMICAHCTTLAHSTQLTAQFAMCIAFAFNMLSTCNTLALFCIVCILGRQQTFSLPRAQRGKN
jgi:hypothetical protein